MIQGPSRTPYEDGLFFFDVQLPSDYPNSPPVFFYISYCTDRLNPNLYEDGKVCVSLLGTWTGKVCWSVFSFLFSYFLFGFVFYLFFDDLMDFFDKYTALLQGSEVLKRIGFESLDPQY